MNDATVQLDAVRAQLLGAGITLDIQKKSVKNINFRLKPYRLQCSVPHRLSMSQMAHAISQRVAWALTHHPQVVMQQQSQQLSSSMTVLWGQEQPFALNDTAKLRYYRNQLQTVIPELFVKWQPIVGATANEVRIKKMHTRWGSCNTRARRVWLSVYLPAYPIECTEYVIVHELCHLHHANHSPAFWRTLRQAMPDYQYWHDRLAGRTP
ncbi:MULTISPECIES: M48 family metallopeptidase [unclassified Psychrobacter]|uniref:M48 family metallopeptidase n=1 Tax=unclassified Psychrobacter TaxID=196806 RepID=UPI0018F3AB7B|nr:MULTISPECIES: M48 family metallopeptidase [unclassified Psychrobacter]